jgi:hypothetical protein
MGDSPLIEVANLYLYIVALFHLLPFLLASPLYGGFISDRGVQPFLFSLLLPFHFLVGSGGNLGRKVLISPLHGGFISDRGGQLLLISSLFCDFCQQHRSNCDAVMKSDIYEAKASQEAKVGQI